MIPTRVLLLGWVTGLFVLNAAESTPVDLAETPPVDLNSPPVIAQNSNKRVAQPLDDLSLLDENLWVEAVSRRPQPIARAALAVTVLDHEDLVKTPAATIPDRLRYVPGVDVYQNRHGQFDVGLRGFAGISSPRTLALYDGRRFDSEELGTVFWIGPLHQSDIRRIEIVKGPSSVAYGANAFGGVIAILSRPVGDTWELHTSTTLGDHGHLEIDGTTMGPLPWHRPLYIKTSIGSSARNDWSGTQSDITITPTPRAAQTGSDDLRADRVHTLVGYRFTEDVSLELDWKRFDLYEWEMIEDFSPGSNYISQVEDKFGAKLRSPWFEIEQLYSTGDGFYSNSIGVFDPMRAFRFTQAGFETETFTTRGQVELDLDNHHITLGASYEEWRSTSNLWAANGRYDDPDTWREVTVRNTAAFGEHQWQVNSDWSTTAGLRLDDHNLVGTNISPRFSVNRRFGSDYYGRAAFSSGYRLPSAVESYMEEFFFTIDDDIEAEKITSLDVSMTGRPMEGIRLEAGAFYNRSNDLLFFRPLDESAMEAAWLDFLIGGDPEIVPGPFFEIRNEDNPNNGFGLELSSTWQANSQWGFSLAGTWQRYRFSDPIRYQSAGFIDPLSGDRIFAFDRTLPRNINAPPDLKLAVGSTWEHRGFEIQGFVRYVSSREVFSFANSDFQQSGLVATDRVDARIALDLAVGWSGRVGTGIRGNIRIGVMNILDDRSPETFEGNPGLLQQDGEKTYSSDVGRRVTLRADFEF